LRCRAHGVGCGREAIFRIVFCFVSTGRGVFIDAVFAAVDGGGVCEGVGGVQGHGNAHCVC